MVQKYQVGKISEAKKTSEPDTNQRFLAAVTYLLGFITGILFLMLEKKDRFIRFHAYQSTALFGVWFVVYIIVGLIPVIKLILTPILFLGALAVWIFLMFKAFSGESYKFPYAGEWAEKQVAKS